jgi:hypothetical protein
LEVVCVERGERDDDEQHQYTEFDQHHDGVDHGGFTGAPKQ